MKTTEPIPIDSKNLSPNAIDCILRLCEKHGVSPSKVMEIMNDIHTMHVKGELLPLPLKKSLSGNISEGTNSPAKKTA